MTSTEMAARIRQLEEELRAEPEAHFHKDFVRHLRAYGMAEEGAESIYRHEKFTQEDFEMGNPCRFAEDVMEYYSSLECEVWKREPKRE